MATHQVGLCGLAIAVVCLWTATAWAQDDDEPATRPLSAPTIVDDAPPIDASKHGTVEAEIPATRESTSGPPTRDQLKHLLLDKRWDRGGFFIGAFGHYAFEVTDQIGDYSYLAPSGGLSLRVGLKHNRFWSTEFSGLWTSKFKKDGDEFNAWGVFLGERFYFSKRRFQPYVGLHVGFLNLQGTNFDGNSFGFSPKANVGVDYYLTETLNIEMDATYHYTVGGIKNSDFVTVSLGLNWF